MRSPAMLYGLAYPCKRGGRDFLYCFRTSPIIMSKRPLVKSPHNVKKVIISMQKGLILELISLKIVSKNEKIRKVSILHNFQKLFCAVFTTLYKDRYVRLTWTFTLICPCIVDTLYTPLDGP